MLLTRLHDTSYHKTVPNVLPAAQQLEKFAAEYATIHLNTNGTSNSTKTYKGKNFGKQWAIFNYLHGIA